jgi:hypothetical protein
MALVNDPNVSTAATGITITTAPPYGINREWCLGDSLFFINKNFDNTDTRITQLSSRFPVQTASIADNAVTSAKIADNAVTSAKIADGSIVNNDISTTAAIAGTKVNPNFGSQAVFTTGTISGGTFAHADVTIGGDGNIGIINMRAPGAGISRYWAGGVWNDVYGARIGLASNGDMYVAGVSLLPQLVCNAVYSYAYVTISDERFKTNIATLENSLSKVLQMRGISYNEKESGKKRIGFSAQEVLKVLPEVVNVADNGIASVSYNDMVSVLLEAIKELTARVSALEARL